jgi:hypothetical protein
MNSKLAVSVLILLVILPLSSKAECDASYQTYRYKSAVFSVTNARRIGVSVYNSMNDQYSRCFTAWIIVNGRYVNLDGLPYDPGNWQQAWASTAPNCFNSGYRVVSGSYGYVEYDLGNYAPYTGNVEVRVSSDCYEVSKADPCFCWNVNVQVVEQVLPQYCYLDIYVKDNQGNPLNAYIYLDGNYLAYSSHEQRQVLIGTHTVSASKPGYSSASKAISCSCGETKIVELVLAPTQVCNPGEIRNRQCACSTQVSYEKCKSDGSGWDLIIENCPSDYSCEDGRCVPVQACDPGYLDEYRCYDNWKQREYLNSDCSTSWVFYEYCSYGCSGGECLSPQPSCTPKYLDDYRCYGDWVQRRYQYSDCSTEWVNWQYCSDGYCSSGRCVYEEPCEISVTVSTPENVKVGSTISTTVEIKNLGDRGGYVDLDAYVCSTDPYCYAMACDGYSKDPRVYVPGNSEYYLTCNATVWEKGQYEVKVSYTGCGYSNTIYSGVFEVLEKLKPKCVAEYINEFKCSGNWKLQLYRYSDCSTAWVYVEYCSVGCSNGQCLPKPTTTLSTTTTTLVEKKEALPITGWAVFTGFVLPLVILLIVFLLAFFVLWFLRKKKFGRQRPEWFGEDC